MSRHLENFGGRTRVYANRPKCCGGVCVQVRTPPSVWLKARLFGGDIARGYLPIPWPAYS